jgi:hypothetical protein
MVKQVFQDHGREGNYGAVQSNQNPTMLSSQARTTLYMRPLRRHHKRRFTCSSKRIKAGQVEAALTYGSKTAVHRKSMTQKCGETLNPRVERERPSCPARGLAGWGGERRIAVLLAGVMRMGK